VLLAALTLTLASCGGGSTAGPIAQSSVATTTTAPPSRAQPAAGTPAAPAAATDPRTATTVHAARPPRQPRRSPPRSSGGAAAPAAPARDGSLADAPAAPSQDAPVPQPAPRPVGTPLDERAKLVLTRRVSAAHYFQQGAVTGTYAGTMETEARITARGVLVKFTATVPGGTISGRAVAVAILDSTRWPGLRGRAIITGGSGRFAGIHGRGLKLTGRSKPDASRTHVRLAGTVSLG
jgi:hypothetical protein